MGSEYLHLVVWVNKKIDFEKNKLQNSGIHRLQFHGNILLATEQAHTTCMREISRTT